MICHIAAVSDGHESATHDRPCLPGLRPGPGMPGSKVCIFEPNWDRVDAARMQADGAGIADRVTIHHVAAIDVCRSSPRARPIM